jgi:hypothetical protein
LALAALSVASTSARAEADDKTACVQAHVQAQRLRREGKLALAQAALGACARDACPTLVRRDCAAWAEAWAAAMPSIVIDARDGAGGEIVDARLWIDGVLRAGRLDGRAIELDPGEHLVAIESAAGRASGRVLVREGERLRPVRLVAGGSASADASPAGLYPHPALWVLASITATATVGFVTFALLGKAKESDLERCAPECEPADVTAMRELYLGADVSLGFTVAGVLAMGLYFVLDAPPRATAATPGGVALRF